MMGRISFRLRLRRASELGLGPHRTGLGLGLVLECSGSVWMLGIPYICMGEQLYLRDVLLVVDGPWIFSGLERHW